MKMKLALGIIVSLTAITLNSMPTENDTKMRMGNEIICEIEAETKMTAKIETEAELADSTIPIQVSPKTENSSKQPKIPTENASANEVPKKENYVENVYLKSSSNNSWDIFESLGKPSNLYQNLIRINKENSFHLSGEIMP